MLPERGYIYTPVPTIMQHFEVEDATAMPWAINQTQELQPADIGRSSTSAPLDMEAGSSAWDTAMVILGAVVGGGILTLPFAMRQAGWALLLLIVLVGGVMMFTYVVIGQVLEHVNPAAEALKIDKQRRDWSIIGLVAFGQTGQTFFGVVQNVNLFGVLISMTMLGGSCLHALFPEVHRHILISVMGCLSTTVLFFDTGWIATFAKLGNLAVAMVMICLLVTGVQLWLAGAEAEHKVVDVQQVPFACGTLVMLFSAHGEAPFIYQQMQNPAEWTGASIMASSMVGAFLVVSAIFGYAILGNAAESSFVVNLGKDLNLVALPGTWNMHLSRLTSGLMFLKLFLVQPVIAMPIVLSVKGWPESIKIGVSSAKLLLMLATTLFCIFFVHKLHLVIELVGSVIETAVSVILPCLTCLKLRGRHLSRTLQLTHIALILIFGIYAMVAGVLITMDLVS